MSVPVDPRVRRGPRTVARSRVVSAVLGITLVAVAAIGYQLSQPGEVEVREAPLGQVVAYDAGTVEVSDVRVGTEIARADTGVSTRGIFVVVHVSLQAPARDNVSVNDVQLRARGVTYQPSTTFSVLTATTGFESSVDFVFEVDPSRMVDLTLDMASRGVVSGYYQRTRTSLGITAANTGRWGAAARGRRVRVDVDPVSQALT